MNHRLYDLVNDYTATNEQEAADRRLMTDFIKAFDDVTTRNNRFGHFTASPWIINEDATKVLMVYHRIYDSWSWCGGHLDGDFDPVTVAVREGKEETGIGHLRLLGEKPLALDVLPVPPHIRRNVFVSAHLHLNITYLCMGKESEPLTIRPQENSDVRWIGIEQINTMVTEKDMRPVYAKLIERTKQRLMDAGKDLSIFIDHRVNC